MAITDPARVDREVRNILAAAADLSTRVTALKLANPDRGFSALDAAVAHTVPTPTAEPPTTPPDANPEPGVDGSNPPAVPGAPE